MKRLGLLLLVTGLAGGALATANAGTNATPRVICHRTSSATKPYVKLAVSARQLRAHLKHAADIIRTPLGACPKAVMTATAGGRAFTVALTGEAETPAGDPVGTGTSTIRLRAGQGQVCYQLAVENLAAGRGGAHPPRRERSGRARRRAAHDTGRGRQVEWLRTGARGHSCRRCWPSRRRTT